MTMRMVYLALVVVLAAPAIARADSYDVKYQEASNDCTNYQTLRAGTLKIEIKKGTLTINIDTIPLLVGVPQKNGEIKAKSKLGPSVIQGADAKYSAGGRIGDGGMLELVLSAEYSVKGKALCSQSWTVAGVRRDEPAKPPKK
jgi:hypothetical protein